VLPKSRFASTTTTTLPRRVCVNHPTLVHRLCFELIVCRSCVSQRKLPEHKQDMAGDAIKFGEDSGLYMDSILRVSHKRTHQDYQHSVEQIVVPIQKVQRQRCHAKVKLNIVKDRDHRGECR
jgi:hypothetical protein